VLVFLVFLFSSFLVTAPSKNGSADFDDLYVKRRSIAQESAFGGPNASKSFQRVHFPQNLPNLGCEIGIFSLNKTINNFPTVHAIFAQSSSISAA
jgi:hypothetical protein